MPRVADSAPGLRREAAMLKAVHARRATPMPGVPQIVFCEERDTLFVLGETALSGVPLFTQLDHHNYRSWALSATDWLIELAGAPVSVSRDRWWSRVIEPVLNDFQRSFGAVVDQRMIQETSARLAKIDSLPLVCEQRDFSPWNVCVTARGELLVLDWESAELDGLPGLDLIYFLTYLAFFIEDTMDSGAFVGTYRGCWSEQTLIGRVNAECLRRYCEALKLDDALMPALRLFTWLLHSRSEYARLTADAGDQPSDEALRHSTFAQLWEAEVRRDNANPGQLT
jgi:aminoglycoside phosphotransferase (APT) family kinase protein